MDDFADDDFAFMNALVDEIAKKNPDVAEMLELERTFKQDPLLMRQYFMAEQTHLDYLAAMKDSREEGFKEGLEEGRKESARRLRSEGILSDEQVADVLDIPVEVVKTL